MTGEPSAAVWLEEQLARALARVDVLAREVTHVQAALAAREQEVDALRQSLAVLDGRTRRFEATQDGVPALRQTLAAVEERLAAESALRRDQFAATGRGQGHEDAAGRSLERALIDLTDRLAALERAHAAVAEHSAHLGGDATARDQAQQQLVARIETLHGQVEMLALAARRDTGDLEQLREALDAGQQHVAALESRTGVMLHDQQRFEADLLALRRLAERETVLADLLEQQRVLRLRIEEGLAALEERAASQRLTGAAEAEGHALLRAQLAALGRTVSDLEARVEAQRQVLLDHFRRVTVSAEEAGRRQTDEIDRQIRAARELLVRLAESADEATREQPL